MNSTVSWIQQCCDIVVPVYIQYLGADGILVDLQHRTDLRNQASKRERNYQEEVTESS